ncbi:MAG TPA: hypothetical protein VGG99_19070 [Acetobacteraceae bacterium]|jgi:hypothetical protein
MPSTPIDDAKKTMKIPVFVSSPSMNNLSPDQERVRQAILGFLDYFDLEPRALGRSDYADGLPLREVLVIARHCAGGIVLGFEQFRATAGTWKLESERQKALVPPEYCIFPSEWNNLEAGIMFGLGLPMLIFREVRAEGKELYRVKGGVFDEGVTEVYLRDMPQAGASPENDSELKHVFLKWHARVSAHYYGSAK